MVCWPMQNFAISLHDRGCHFCTNINCRPQITALHWIIVRVFNRIVPKHNPIIKPMLAEFTDIRSPTQYYSLWDFPLQHIDIQGYIWSQIGFELQCIVSYPLGCTWLNHISTSSIIQISDSPISLNFSWRVHIHLLYMEIRLLTLIPKRPKGLFFWSIHHHISVHAVSLKEQGQVFMCISFPLHWVRSWPAKMGWINLFIPISSPELFQPQIGQFT